MTGDAARGLLRFDEHVRAGRAGADAAANLDGRVRSVFDSVAADIDRHTLVIVDCGDHPDRAAVAAAFATRALPRRMITADARFNEPAKDTWTVSEIEAAALVPSARRPSARNLLFIDRVDAARETVWTRLLKTVEEPLAATTFVFLAVNAAVLPDTLRGRASATVTIGEDVVVGDGRVFAAVDVFVGAAFAGEGVLGAALAVNAAVDAAVDAAGVSKAERSGVARDVWRAAVRHGHARIGVELREDPSDARIGAAGRVVAGFDAAEAAVNRFSPGSLAAVALATAGDPLT